MHGNVNVKLRKHVALKPDVLGYMHMEFNF
jgi:hypothetical protein